MYSIKGLLEAEGADGYIVLNHSDIRYFSRLTSSNIALLITEGESFVFSDARYKYRIEAQSRFTPVVVSGNILKAVSDKVNKLGLKKVLADPTDFSHFSYLEYLEPVKDVLFFKTGITKEARAIKREDEIESIIKAQNIAEAALKEIFPLIREGITTAELAARIDFLMSIKGSEEPSFPTIVLSGAGTADCHGVPDNTRVKNGDFVLFDFGATVNGYRSDMTRTVAYGEITPFMEEIYGIVLTAHEKAAASLRAGIRASEADMKARGYIKEKGFGDLFLHSTGHGVGLDIHEYPTVSENSEAVLERNMAVTVEPGIYIKNDFGIRIEDTYIIEENGSYSTAKTEKKLIKLK